MNGTPVTVEGLLNMLEVQCAIDGKNSIDVRDPLEPDYDRGRQVARAFYNPDSDTAFINSYAHGPHTFSLTEALRALRAPGWVATVRVPGRPFEGEAQKPKKPGLVITRGDEMEAEPVDWVWKNHFARSKLNLIAGPAGLGKSQLLLYITKVITTGGTWPDKSPCTQGAVLLIQNEDGENDTVAPRAIATGVDMTRFFHAGAICVDEGKGLVERLVQLDRDLEAIGATLDERPEIDTLMIDPLNAYLGKTDSYKDADVRAVLTSLAAFTARRRLTVIVLNHLNKGSGRAAADRIAGSGAFVQLCRTNHMVALDPDDPELRIFQPFKRNLGKGFEGFAFRIVTEIIKTPKFPAGIETSCLEWGGEKTIDLDEALSGDRNRGGKVSRLDEAKAWLQEFLRDGPVLADEVLDASKANGIAPGTLARAKRELGIVPRKLTGERFSEWVWELPAAEATCAPSDAAAVSAPNVITPPVFRAA